MKRYIKSNSKVYAWVNPEDADGTLSVARNDDWNAFKWKPKAWGKLIGYDKTTELFMVQWPNGSTSQHPGYDLMTVEQADDLNKNYFVEDDDES